MEFTYEIGGRTYVQRPLVLGQLKQLLNVLKNMQIPADADAIGLVNALGDCIHEALAVVLTEKGMSPRDKDIAALAQELAFSMTPEEALRVIEDFFACNPVSSLLERSAGAIEKITAILTVTGSGPQ